MTVTPAVPAKPAPSVKQAQENQPAAKQQSLAQAPGKARELEWETKQVEMQLKLAEMEKKLRDLQQAPPVPPPPPTETVKPAEDAKPPQPAVAQTPQAATIKDKLATALPGPELVSPPMARMPRLPAEIGVGALSLAEIDLVPPRPPESSFVGLEKFYQSVYKTNATRIEELGIGSRLIVYMDRDGWFAMASQKGLRLAASKSPTGCPTGDVVSIDVNNRRSSRFVNCKNYTAHRVVRPPRNLKELWEDAVQEAQKRLGTAELYWWTLYPIDLWQAVEGKIWHELGGRLKDGESVEVIYVPAMDGKIDVQVSRALAQKSAANTRRSTF